MLEYRIFAYEVNNLTDARYFAAWYADWISFHLPALNAGDDIGKIQSILSWIDGLNLAYRPHKLNPDFAFQLYDQLKLDAIHIDLTGNEEWISNITGIPIVAEISNVDQLLVLKEQKILAFIIDSTIFADVHLFQKKNFPDATIFLKYDSNEDLRQAEINKLHNIGLAIKGGEEERPGYKSFDEVDKLFELIEKKEE